MGQDIGPVETVRTRGVGTGLRIGLTLGLLLVAAAAAKPWGAFVPSPSATTLMEGNASASQGVASRSLGSPAPTIETGVVQSDSLCPNPDGWRIVVDDVEFGKAVRTWLVPTAYYASADQPPALTRSDVSTFVSGRIRQLAFCVPSTADGRPPGMWSGELWYMPDISGTTSMRLVGNLASAGDAYSAVVHLASGVVGWPAGLYLLEANVVPATAPLWVPIVLASPPAA